MGSEMCIRDSLYLEDKYEASWTFCVVYPQNVTPSTPARFFLQETQRLFGR